ncbi:MAG: hypothetical protein WB564_06330 [Dehalococcoidia bacterium]
MDLEDFRLWLSLILLLPAAIYYVIKVTDYFGHKKAVGNSTPAAQIKTVSLLKIKQGEPSRRPPGIFTIMYLVPACILLAFGGGVIYMWIAGIAELQMDFWIVLFFIMFIGFPLYMLIDHFLIQPRYYRLNRSHVAKEAIVTVGNDIDTIFDACYRVLDSMQAAIRMMEKPDLLKASIRNFVMTITLIQIAGSKVRVYILSDSKWLTVRWDAGANQRNIDSFLRELSKQ